MKPGGINYVTKEELDALVVTYPIEVQVAEASALAARFKALTGQPIMVHPAQMKYFKDAGVDCSNLMVYPEIPTR